MEVATGMSADRLQYERMVEDALRGVVRRALQEAAKRGLPGSHHFYITFRTDRSGVGIAEWLHARYPRDMTIVLEHQFWDLEVGEDAFSVTLTFNDKPERLTVPFAAIIGFADPSVKFGLQFEGRGEPADAPKKTPAKEMEKEAPGGPPAEDGAAIVALDSFRKKK